MARSFNGGGFALVLSMVVMEVMCSSAPTGGSVQYGHTVTIEEAAKLWVCGWHTAKSKS